MKSGLNQKWLVCRVCLKQPKEEMQTIFDRNVDKDLTRMILECGGVPIKQFDHYPDKICTKCFKYLQVAYKFRIICQRSHKQLSKFLAPVEVEKIDEFVYDDDETESLPNAAVNDESLMLDNTDDMVVKMEQTDSVGDVKEEYTVHIQEGDEDFVEIYEPMTEEEEKEVFQLADEEFENEEEIEYLELEDLDLPSSDNEDINQTDSKNQMRTRLVIRKPIPQSTAIRAAVSVEPSTSQGVMNVKRAKKEPRGRKPKDTSYICDFCGNKYPSQSRLTEHIKLHRGIKPHECEICGHCFAQTQQLARHMNTHTGNRPYKCSYCPAAFADLSTRNKHHRIHTNERPYVCDVCGKAFTYTNTLKFHKMIHTGEKPFVCDICNKGFQQNYKLRAHRLTHEKKGITGIKLETETIIPHNAELTYHEVHVDAAAQQLLEI